MDYSSQLDPAPTEPAFRVPPWVVFLAILIGVAATGLAFENRISGVIDRVGRLESAATIHKATLDAMFAEVERLRRSVPVPDELDAVPRPAPPPSLRPQPAPLQ